MPVILFYHIGKTAGKTIKNLFSEKEFIHLDFDNLYNKSLKKELDVKLLYFVPQHGHMVKSFYENINKIKELKSIYNDNLFIFTIFRNPLEHTISLYNWFTNRGIPTCSKEKIADTLRFNYQSHYLYNCTTFWKDTENYLNQEDTTKLISYIDLYIDHIGIQDNLDYTLKIINNKFNINLEIIKSCNVEKNKIVLLSDLTENQIAIIAKKTELDNYLYNKYKLESNVL